MSFPIREWLKVCGVRELVVSMTLALCGVIAPACFALVDSPEVALARGDIALHDGRAAEAVTAYRDALSLAPGSLVARLKLAQALVSAGQSSEAIAQLEALAGLYPRNAAVQLSLAETFVRAGRERDALQVLDGLVADSERQASQAQLVRGIALVRLGERRKALQVFEELRSKVATPDVAQVAGRFREQLRTSSLNLGTGGPAWSGWVKLGLQFDDNPVIAPTTNVFGLADLKQESLGTSLTGGVTRVLDQRPDRRVATSYNFLQTLNYSVNDVNLQDHMLDLDLAWVVKGRERSAVTGLRAVYDNLLVNETSFLQRFSMTPSVAWSDESRATTQLTLRFEHKDFLNNAAVDNTVEDRDADNVAATIVRAFPTQADRGVAQLGLLFDSESARGANLDYEGRLLFAAFAGPLPGTKLRYNARAQIHLRDYDNVHSFFLLAREDKEFASFAALTYPLSGRRLLSFEQTFTRNASNIALFDFSRLIHAVTMRWTF